MKQLAVCELCAGMVGDFAAIQLGGYWLCAVCYEDAIEIGRQLHPGGYPQTSKLVRAYLAVEIALAQAERAEREGSVLTVIKGGRDE